MSGKCTGTTPTGSSNNDCTAGGANCIHDNSGGSDVCKCKDNTFVDTAAGCKLKLAKCGDRCST